MAWGDEHYNPMRNRERKHPLEYAIFAFLVLTFLATCTAAFYTRRQWITADDSEKRQLRAYVGPTIKPLDVTTSFAPPLTATIHLGVRNSGLTPAYMVTHESGGSICDHPLPASFPFEIIKSVIIGADEPITVFPGTIDNLEIAISLSRPMTPNEFSSIAGGNSKRLCFWGTIYYTDAFEQRRHTNFCYSYFGTPDRIEHQACEAHNDAN